MTCQYGLRQAPWRGGKADIVRDFVESCRRYDIRPALFISVRYNAYWNVTQGIPVYGPRGMIYGQGASSPLYNAYLRSCEEMVEELCGRYGELLEFWFDGGVVPPEERNRARPYEVNNRA